MRCSDSGAGNVWDVHFNGNSTPDYSGTPESTVYIPSTISGSFNNHAEFRIDRVLRTAAWDAAEYSNQNAPGTFATAGTPEDASATTTAVGDGLTRGILLKRPSLVG